MGDELTEIHGTCAPGFEPVRQAFAANFAERGEIGASVAVVARGEPVVNLWAGWANPAKTQAWRVVDHQGGYLVVRAPADRPGRA